MSGDFWSRRREAVAAEAEAETTAALKAQERARDAELEALPDEEILAQFDLPDPDMLDSPDAVRDFLSHGLPQRLKTRALRRLWRLNPVLANVDGLVDYGEDYTDAAMVVEGLQTAYQVGKGMLAHCEQVAREAASDGTQAATDTPDVNDEDVLAQVETEDGPEPIKAIAPADTSNDVDEFQDDPSAPAPQRRMTFQFESVT